MLFDKHHFTNDNILLKTIVSDMHLCLVKKNIESGMLLY